MRRVRTWLSWSTGKDAAWALQRLLDDDAVELCGLFTTVDAATQRVPFQGTGRALLELQAAATGLPLRVVDLPPEADDETWKGLVGGLLAEARDSGIEQVAYGDLHLADLRAWREAALEPLGLAAQFPLWAEDSAVLARQMLDGGLVARITGLDPTRVDPVWLGKPFDAAFLESLAPDVDPCGEYGEFHTFVCAGPMLHERFEIGCAEPVIERGFLVAEPVLSFPLDGTLDLHGINPREVGDLVDDWIDASRSAGLRQLRIVHGKGIGALRETVHARLRRRKDVASFRLGGEGGGGWGATVVELEP